jgi:ribose transport system permease protein
MAYADSQLQARRAHWGAALSAFVSDNLLALVIVVIYLAVGLKNPDYLSIVSLRNIAAQASIVGLLSIGLTLVIMSGGIDLSVGSVMALTSMVTAWTYVIEGMPFPLCVALGASVGVVSGILAATFILYLKLPPFISTLGLLIMLSGLARFVGQNTTLSGLPVGFSLFWNTMIVGIPLPFLIFVGVAAIAGLVKTFTPLGRATLAIGSNYRAAVISGVGIKRTLYACYMISGALASVAGLLMTARLNSGQALVGQGYEMYAITAAVVGGASLSGGQGSIKGAVYGAIMISIIYTGISFFGLSTYYQEILIGIVLVLAVMFNRTREVAARARMLAMLSSSRQLESAEMESEEGGTK